MKNTLIAAVLFPILFIVFGLISSIEEFFISNKLILKEEFMNPYDSALKENEIPDKFKVDRIDKCFGDTDNSIHQFHQD